MNLQRVGLTHWLPRKNIHKSHWAEWTTINYTNKSRTAAIFFWFSCAIITVATSHSANSFSMAGSFHPRRPRLAVVNTRTSSPTTYYAWRAMDRWQFFLRFYFSRTRILLPFKRIDLFEPGAVFLRCLLLFCINSDAKTVANIFRRMEQNCTLLESVPKIRTFWKNIH